MKFSNRNDIEAPLEFVFDSVSNFAKIERLILRRGIDLQRTATAPGDGVGTAWRAVVSFHGRSREVAVAVSAFDRPNGYAVQGGTDGLAYAGTVETIALSRSRTRLLLGIELKPTNLSARLLVQSLKLAKGTLSTRLDKRMALFCKEIEDRYTAQS